MKFSSHPYAQADVTIFDNGDSYLTSYSTQVCGVENGVFWIKGLYSLTTRRHIAWYLEEMGLPLTYHDVKRLYLDGFSLDLSTGEVIK